MQPRSFAKPATITRQNRSHSSTPTHEQPQSPMYTAPRMDELSKIFNTSLVSSKAKSKRDFSSELFALTDSTAFKTILNAVQQLARVQGISEKQAAEQVIQTFRRMDELWGEYLFHEGIDRLKGHQTQR